MPESPNYPMDPVRGAIIMCDHLDQMQNGKWLIVGTHQRWYVRGDILDLPKGINLYLRFQREKSGPFQGALKLVARDLSSLLPPLLEISFEGVVKDPNLPVEVGFATPAVSFARPNDENKSHDPLVLTYTWLLKVDGHDVASAPLIIQYSAKDPSHAHNDPRQP